MKFSVVNSSGVVTASGSTDPGSGGGGSGKSELGPFTFWSPGSDCPTTYTNMTYPLVGWNGSQVATMNSGIKMPSAGYVNGLATLVNGPTGSVNINLQYFKNGNATGLLTTTSVPNQGGVATYNSAAGGASYSFAAGDVISVYIQAASSGVNQSFSAFLELVLS